MCGLNDIFVDFKKHEGCIVGICDALPRPFNRDKFVPFVSSDIEKRTNPAANLPGAKSIIVIGVPYELQNFPPMPEGAGFISVLGTANDYHNIVRGKLKRLAELMPGGKHKILVDSGTLDERALAVKAGLGYIGLSGLVISKEYGSRFNIGVMLTTLELPASKSSKPENCPPDCRKCIDACPTKALHPFDATRCISYLTQKDELTLEEAALIGRHMYGCDICQDACPKNHPQNPGWAMPKVWLSMTNAEFAEAYGHTAMLWRGANLLRRNAKIVERNLSK